MVISSSGQARIWNFYEAFIKFFTFREFSQEEKRSNSAIFISLKIKYFSTITEEKNLTAFSYLL